MTKKEQQLMAEAIEKLKVQVENMDYESAHSEADDILCELLNKLGFSAVVDEWNKVGKWYA
jgi:predicted GNAT family N-acyltransferase